MYKKILVPIDGSVQSQKAEGRAVELAKLTNGSVTFMHVVLPPMEYAALVGEATITIPQSVIDEIEESAKKLLADEVDKFKDSGVKINTELLKGHVSDIICRLAKEEEYDLIVIGSRGLGAIKGYLMGSISNKVAHHAPCSVLIVH